MSLGSLLVILMLFSKIALSLETSSKFRCFVKTFFDVMKTSKLRSRSERLQNFDDVLNNCVFARDVLKISLMCLLKGEVLGRSFWYRFGVGFLGLVFRVFDRLRKNSLLVLLY